MRQDDGDTELLGGQLCSFDASEIREVSVNDFFEKFRLPRSHFNRNVKRVSSDINDNVKIIHDFRGNKCDLQYICYTCLCTLCSKIIAFKLDGRMQHE